MSWHHVPHARVSVRVVAYMLFVPTFVCVCVYVCMYVCMYVPASYPCGRMHQPPRAPTVTINVLWWNVLSYGIECVL